jgi:hypothetical protein
MVICRSVEMSFCVTVTGVCRIDRNGSKGVPVLVNIHCTGKSPVELELVDCQKAQFAAH